MRWLVIAFASVACGVRAPSPVDVGALLAKQGPIEAQRTLEMQVLANPRDVGAELALAALDERIGRVGEALDAFEAVLRLGGPLGTRWHADDRARFAGLLAARGRARLARGSRSAAADLARARQYGATVSDAELADARQAEAIVLLRHVDAEVRARGRAELAFTARSPAERAAFGLRAWDWGAKREAYEQLAAWHAQTRPPRDAVLQAAYIRALAWWQPADVEPPPRDELVGDDRCWFATADCTPALHDDPAPDAPPAHAAIAGDPRALAAARYAHARFGGVADEAVFLAIATAYAREPVVADRLGRDVVATAIDTANAHAALGALFDALGDPARARANWLAAANASDEADFVRGVAEACARGADPLAALVYTQRAAAASGDPAPVFVAVARELEEVGAYEGALVAAHSAIDLAGVAVLPAALAVGVEASRALGRDDQAERFARERGKLAVRVPEPNDRAEALAAIRALPNAVTLARAWVTSRAHPRDVELLAALYIALPRDDSRRAQLASELVALAGDVNDERALAAARALRH